MKRYIAILLMIAGTAQADTSINAVISLSDSLGYESTGYGAQLHTTGQAGNWGWSAQAMALQHAKISGTGQRYQAIAMGRRYFGDWFVEAGGQWRGYATKFPNGSEWSKYGTAPGIGIGTNKGGTEWTFRYFAPDSTMNETEMIAASVDVLLSEMWLFGATVEQWRFDQGGERLSGTQAMFRFGWRF
jgi:hypothetical protein